MSSTGGTWVNNDVLTAQALNYKTLALQTATPSAPTLGQLWYNTSTNQLMIWNGTFWSPQFTASTDDYVIYKSGSTYKALGNSAQGFGSLNNVTPDIGALYNACIATLPVDSNSNALGSIGILSNVTPYAAVTKLSKPQGTVLHGSGRGTHIIGPTNDWTLEIPSGYSDAFASGAIRDIVLDGNSNSGAKGGLHLIDQGAQQIVENVYAGNYTNGVGFCIDYVGNQGTQCEDYALIDCTSTNNLTGLYLKNTKQVNSISFDYGLMSRFLTTCKPSQLANQVGMKIDPGLNFVGCNWDIHIQINPSVSVSHTGLSTGAAGSLFGGSSAPTFAPSNIVMVTIENLGSSGYGIGASLGNSFFANNQTIFDIKAVGGPSQFATWLSLGTNIIGQFSESRLGSSGNQAVASYPLQSGGYEIIQFNNAAGTERGALESGSSGNRGVIALWDATAGAMSYLYIDNGIAVVSASKPT